MTKDEGARRSHPKQENLRKNTLKEKDLRVIVYLRAIEALMKKKFLHRKDDQKTQRNEIDLEATKTKKNHQRYSSLASLSSSSNDDFDENKFRNNESNESTDPRFRVLSDQYKCSLPRDMAKCAN